VYFAIQPIVEKMHNCNCNPLGPNHNPLGPNYNPLGPNYNPLGPNYDPWRQKKSKHFSKTQTMIGQLKKRLTCYLWQMVGVSQDLCIESLQADDGQCKEQRQDWLVRFLKYSSQSDDNSRRRRIAQYQF